MDDEENVLSVLLDFFEYCDLFEKKKPNDMELGFELRKLINEYRDKFGE